jgi:hypothetical protein
LQLFALEIGALHGDVNQQKRNVTLRLTQRGDNHVVGVEQGVYGGTDAQLQAL